MNGRIRFPALRLMACLLAAAASESAGPRALAASSPTVPGPDGATDEALVTLVREVIGVLNTKGIAYNREALKQAILEAAMKTIDAGGSVYTEAEYALNQEQNQGWFNSPGFWLTRSEGEYRIGGFYPDRTVDGMEIDDTLLSVEGQEISSLPLTEVQNLLRSQNRERIALMLRKKNNELKEVEAKYTRTKLPSIYAAEPLNDSLCYLRLNGVYEDAGKQVEAALKKWHEDGRYGLVLDLRGAAGSDVDAVAHIAGLFASQGDFLFAFRDQNNQDLSVYKATGEQPADMPVMVLVDQRTREAAELLAAVMKGSAQGVLVIGETTLGHMLVRERVALSSGEQLVLPTRRLALARGPTYDGRVGIEPNLMVSAGAQDYEYEPLELAVSEPEAEANHRLRNRLRGDAALKRATDVLLGLKALNIQTRAHSAR